MNLFIVFLTGLTTGGLSCLAMQGGLLASVIANQKGQERHNNGKDKQNQLDWLPVAMFLLAKLISHTILGFLLGLLGSAITLNLGTRLFFQIFTALFMFATAMNLLDVHPIFRYLAFQPPKFLQRLIRGTSKSKALFAPAVLGLMTIFVPCGVTQAMEVLVINSGNPFLGAAIMFTFILGTSPIFAILGVATAKLSDNWYKKFTKFAAIILIGMTIYTVNGVLLVVDSPLTINKVLAPVADIFSVEKTQKIDNAKIASEIQQADINITNRGYEPKYFKVKRGVPVQMNLNSNGIYSCSLSFVFREFGINANLSPTDSQSFTFTPEKKGKYVFSCSMGMYTGIMEVI